MHLKGNFESSFLASLLQLLCSERKTGVLKLTSEQEEVKIFIMSGTVIYAMGSQREMRLGYLLRSKGIITPEQLKKCLIVAKDKRQALGKVLVSKGYISSELLKKIVRKQAEDVIFNLFLWEKGGFEYNDARINLKGLVATQLDIMTIILEATRRIDEMSILKKQIPDDQMVLKISEKVQDKEEIKFNAVEWRFLSLIDGTRNVRQLINESGFDDFTVYKVLNSLLSFGLIEQSLEPEFKDQTTITRYAEIVTLYHHILQMVSDKLLATLAFWPYLLIQTGTSDDAAPDAAEVKTQHKAELQKWVNAIIQQCKPIIIPRPKDLFKNFYPHNPLDTNIELVLDALKVCQDDEEAAHFLINSFSEFIGNLLGSVPSVMGHEPSCQLLEDLRNELQPSREAKAQGAEYGAAIDALEAQLARIEQQYAAQPEREVLLTGLFALS